MVKEAIATGDSVEQAFEEACKLLGVESHEAEFEILELPEKKKFGLFGGAPAKVRAFIKSGPAEAAADYLKQVLGQMGIPSVEITIAEQENGALLTSPATTSALSSATEEKHSILFSIFPAWWQIMWKILITESRSTLEITAKSGKKHSKRSARRWPQRRSKPSATAPLSP